MKNGKMLSLAMALASLGSLHASADGGDHVLRIHDAALAESGMILIPQWNEPRYIQEGKVVDSAALDDKKPYCMAFGTYFKPSAGQSYRVISIEERRPDPVIDELNIVLETGSEDQNAAFSLLCQSMNSTITLSDVKKTVTNIFDITP